jgi:hypothetical protein
VTEEEYVEDYQLERKTRQRASNRGFQIIRIGGREGRRRLALGIGPSMLIDHERVHLFAATMKQIANYIDAFLTARACCTTINASGSKPAGSICW